MKITAKNVPAGICRRSMLQSLLASIFGVTVLGMGENRVDAAETKATQSAVEYHNPATGSAHCDNCKYFKPPSSCYVVEGDIAPTGWCDKYAKKSD